MYRAVWVQCRRLITYLKKATVSKKMAEWRNFCSQNAFSKLDCQNTWSDISNSFLWNLISSISCALKQILHSPVQKSCTTHIMKTNLISKVSNLSTRAGFHYRHACLPVQGARSYMMYAHGGFPGFNNVVGIQLQRCTHLSHIQFMNL